MTLFAFRGAKSHEWIFCDTINVNEELPDGARTGLQPEAPSLKIENSRSQ
jgi:hypothetical protein